MSVPLRVLGMVLAVIIGASILLAGVGFGAALYFNAPPGAPPVDAEAIHIEADGATALIEVQDGESAISVGRRLERAGIIKTHYFWNLLAHFDKEYIKAGTSRLTLPASQLDIYHFLQSGVQVLYRVTIPEGVTQRRAAALMEEAGVCDAEAFLVAAGDQAIRDAYHVPGQTMEGYLFPDTYLFPQNYPAEKVVRAMADNFFARLMVIQGDLTLSARELNDLVILASIVEREYRVSDEAPLIAGVFQNRIDIGMALESCATVEYVITEIQGKPHPDRLLTADTRIENPYNTYLRRGLPPGPISAPGAVALSAALRPQESDYLFFRVVDPQEGRHYFSKDFDEHIRAGQLYVKGN